MQARKDILDLRHRRSRQAGVYCSECGQSAIVCGGTHGGQDVPPLHSASGWTIAGLPDETVLDAVPGDGTVDGFLVKGSQVRSESPIVVDSTPTTNTFQAASPSTKEGEPLTVPHDVDADAQPDTMTRLRTPSSQLPKQPILKRKKSKKRKSSTKKGFLIGTIALALVVALVMLVGVLQVPLPPQVTLHVTPVQRMVHQVEHVNAVLGTPGSGEATARLLKVSTSPQSIVAHASGKGFTQSVSAHGSLTLTNESSSWQTIPAGASYAGRSGIKVVTDTLVQVPPVDLTTSPPTLGQAEVPAHSQQGGDASNIPARDIDACCAAGVAVRNLSSFSGGRDGQPYPILQSSDIQEAATPLEQKLMRSATNTVGSQVSARERLVSTPHCTSVIQSSQGDGAHVESTRVQIQVTCSAEAYRTDQVASRAWTHLQEQPSPNAQDASALRSSYAPSLTGTKILRAAVSDVGAGTITLTVWVQGVWVRQFGPEQQSWMRTHLAGKRPNEVRGLLSPAQGIERVTFSWHPEGQVTFPSDPTQIIILIRPGGTVQLSSLT